MNVLLDSRFLTRQPSRHATPLIVPMTQQMLHKDARHGGHGYFAGTVDGIVTVAGIPAVRRIYLMDLQEMRIIRSVWSNKNGEYFIGHLDPNREYLAFARDHERNYEPVAWDYLTPATTLTLAEQLQLLHERGYQISDNNGEFHFV